MSVDRAYPVLVLAVALMSLPACSRGPRNFENENDRLRAQNLELRRSVESLEKTLTRRDAELATLRERLDGARPLAGVPAPALTTVELDRYSGPVDTDGDGRDEVMRLYLKTRDQHGRALPVEGVADVRLVLLGDEDQEPASLLGRAYEAEALRERYRNGFTGTHYTFELPLDAAPSGVSSVAARVRLTNAATGVAHEATGAYTVTR